MRCPRRAIMNSSWGLYEMEIFPFLNRLFKHAAFPIVSLSAAWAGSAGARPEDVPCWGGQRR